MSFILSLLVTANLASAAQKSQVLYYSEYHNEAVRLLELNENLFRMELCTLDPRGKLDVLNTSCQPLSANLGIDAYNELTMQLVRYAEQLPGSANWQKWLTNVGVGIPVGTLIGLMRQVREQIWHLISHPSALAEPEIALTFTIAAAALYMGRHIYAYMDDRFESRKSIYSALSKRRDPDPQLIDANHRSWPMYLELLQSHLAESGLNAR